MYLKAPNNSTRNRKSSVYPLCETEFLIFVVIFIDVCIELCLFKLLCAPTGTIHDEAALLEFASLGSYLEYDLFGIETSHYQLCADVDMPSDAQRIQRIKTLVKAGFSDKILLSHDIHTRHRLVRTVL